MLMLYNSDQFAVVQFDTAADAVDADVPARGGYEIVDKFARKEIFLDGALAAHFRAGVDELIKTSPSEEEIDAYIARFSGMAQQPVVLH
jgi:hypothetical protein